MATTARFDVQRREELARVFVPSRMVKVWRELVKEQLRGLEVRDLHDYYDFTSHSAPAFAGVFAPGSTDFVWPHPNGQVRGQGVEPLHPNVPFAAMQDAKLYEMLALFDALRVGRARERGMAIDRLATILDPNTPRPPKPTPKG